MSTHLGIMTSKGPLGFRGIREQFRGLTEMGKKMGVPVTVFTTNDWPTEGSATIKGYQWNNSWRPVTTSLPTVVYNRIPTRWEERLPVTNRCKNALNEAGIPWFNPNFFNKQDLYSWIKQDQLLQGHLPTTYSLQGNRIKQQLENLDGMWYLKPVHGKAGDGFFRLIRTAGHTDIIYQTNGSRKRRVFTTLTEAATFVQRHKKNGPYILQQGIALATWNSSPYDLRLLIQKDESGNWGVAGIGARVAGKDGITTHVPNGGSIQNAAYLLSNSFGKHAEQIIDFVQGRALQLATHIESHVTGLVGEMSMDIGVDQQGQMWFFEANAKPMKFDESQIRSKSFQRIIEYATYLSENRMRIQ